MSKKVVIIGAGLAGSEAALQLAARGVFVYLYEMRPSVSTPVHTSGDCAELVCSNSFKSQKPDSAAGMLKHELSLLGSQVYAAALRHSVPAGGALAVNRTEFSLDVTAMIECNPFIEVIRKEVLSLKGIAQETDAVVVASGPLTSSTLAADLAALTGANRLFFYDAAAPIVMADSLDFDKLFCQSRYEDAAAGGDYLNAPFSQEEYDAFIDELVAAERVTKRDFESKDLFQACQPIEEVARKGHDAPRFGMLKPVGLTDPHTGCRPWAALQLRAEDSEGMSYNLVGFQTNLTFPEQRRVFRMIPGLEQAEFARYGVMHRNTFIEAPKLLDACLRLRMSGDNYVGAPVFVAGQLAGTEGYCEAIRSGLHVAFSVLSLLEGKNPPSLPCETAFGALLAYATNPATVDYQPMHVNFGIMKPLNRHIRNKRERYAAYAQRGASALREYCDALEQAGFAPIKEFSLEG